MPGLFLLGYELNKSVGDYKASGYELLAIFSLSTMLVVHILYKNNLISLPTRCLLMSVLHSLAEAYFLWKLCCSEDPMLTRIWQLACFSLFHAMHACYRCYFST